MDWLEQKILGCLAGAAAGDAMGAATELRTQEQIAQRFGGYVTDFLSPPDDTFARGNRAGQITDDFSCAYVTCEQILKNGGKITTEIAKQALLEWAKINHYFRFAGPTTRAAIEALKGTPVVSSLNFTLANDYAKATNGGAMKISPVALFSGGDVDKAIELAVVICGWTHNNNIALSGAAAIAAATAMAMHENATLYDVLQSGLYGARQGDKIGRESGVTLAGPSVERRIQMAVMLAELEANLDGAMRDISNIIGTGLPAAEAVPAAFGLMVAAKANAEQAICAAVNIGNDTDTIATMVGGILGTLNGINSLPKHYLPLLEKENDIELQVMAKEIRCLL